VSRTRIGFGWVWLAKLKGGVDVAPTGQVFPVNESNCDAKTAGAAGAANAV